MEATQIILLALLSLALMFFVYIVAKKQTVAARPNEIDHDDDHDNDLTYLEREAIEQDELARVAEDEEAARDAAPYDPVISGRSGFGKGGFGRFTPPPDDTPVPELVIDPEALEEEMRRHMVTAPLPTPDNFIDASTGTFDTNCHLISGGRKYDGHVDPRGAE